MSFEIKLPLFQGPFDLLLFFIERDELDIRDIPIARITDEFLAYIRHIEQRNIELASEFILVAATLMQIKAKMLLPRVEVNELGEEIDPREELVRHLLEYKKYKSVIGALSDKEELRLAMEKRGNIVHELKAISEVNNVEAELQDIDLYRLLKVYMRVMERFEVGKNKPVHTVVPYPYTIEQQKKYVLDTVKAKKRVAFTDFIQLMPDKVAIIYNFLSILELLQLQLLKLQLGEGYNNFYVVLEEGQ